MNNVLLIDPNEVNINTTIINNVPFVNGIPQYQDMYIFAELTAESRGRTVIMTTNLGENSIGTVKTGLETDRNVNFMGNDQNNDVQNPHYLSFTTNYYDGSTGKRIQYEGFGITDIKILVNSSYVPQVNVKFVDIRGLSFFNQENSPYRMLFEFPPPLFHLTVKGYYGKALKYDLHLVKYTSEFLSENGNFVIDAQFVAMTFAPLADIPFRYVINFPLIEQYDSMNSDTTILPRNTYELILKVKDLYSTIEKEVSSGNESKELDNINKKIETIDGEINKITNYKNDEILKKGGEPYLIHVKYNSEFYHDGNTYPNTGDTYTIAIVKNTAEYDTIIKEFGIATVPNNIKDRLYIVYISPDMVNSININSYFNQYKSSLLSAKVLTLNINQNDIVNPSVFIGNSNILTIQQINTIYVGIDITNYYVKLYKQKLDLLKSKSEISKQIGIIVNNSITGKLGMQPTIYNIFKIMLDDVDTFFRILKTTSQNAETAHNEPEAKNKIIDNNPLKNNEKVYAFPLIINRNSVVCGGTKEERIAPIKLSEQISFPEMDLVKDFIKTFQTQARMEELSNMRANQTESGSNVWIPISPIDSELVNTNLNSPYINLDGGISDSLDDKLLQAIKITLKRFYMLSQGIFPYEFYESDEDVDKNNYIKFYAESEALNLVNSLSTPDYIENIKINATKYGKDINSFYDYVKNANDTYFNENGENEQINLYSFSNDKIKYFPIDPALTTAELLYTDKQNIKYEGVNLDIGDIDMFVMNDESDSPINKFIKNNSNFFTEYFFKVPILDGEEKLVSYTKENIPYIIDKPYKTVRRIFNDTSTRDNIEWRTRYLYEFGFDQLNTDFESIFDSVSNYEDVLDKGNSILTTLGYGIKLFGNLILSQGGNIVELWIDVLSKFDEKIYNKIIGGNDYNPKLSSLVILSNFGYNLSPFNNFPNRLNDYIFNLPAIIEIPSFMSAYIGAIIIAIEEGWDDDVINFFNEIKNNDGDDTFVHKGYFVFADIHDINAYLSVIDKKSFKAAYNDFFNDTQNGYPVIIEQLKKVNWSEVNGKSESEKNDFYTKLLNPNENDGIDENYNYIIKPLITRKNIANYSQITFKMNKNAYAKAYTSIANLNNVENSKNINNKYFLRFFQFVLSYISKINDTNNKEKEAQKKLLADEDIMNQTYYSFKNINDKWLSSPSSNFNGYPFGNGKKLIDSFAFVDRAMNPIGDTMINAEILTDLFNDPNISLYSAISQILSINGFEFFPLQNFMNFENDDWKNTFKIDVSGENSNSPAFVCMYIGGTSSYPTVSANGFENDGIEDLGNEKISDFNTQECGGVNTNLDNQVEGHSNFPWRQVRAFRVKFGEQNQSMFINIKIDSKEYPETNESIQILSRLAGDNKINAPTPKGQSLYNVYENRAYKASVTMLGDVLIQPTQYFQIENVPMFNGAYIILSVEHTITANRMLTTFSGTKILKYPIPRVTNPVVFAGLDDLDMNMTTFNNIVAGNQIVDLPDDYGVSEYLTYHDIIKCPYNISNIPTEDIMNYAKNVAKLIYDPICKHFVINKTQLTVTSFYRSPEYNAYLRDVVYKNEPGRVSNNSSHMTGSAVDIQMPWNNDNTPMYDFPLNVDIFIYIAQNLKFDQLIWEKGDGNNPRWVHASYISEAKNRNKLSLYVGNGKYKHANNLNDFLTLKKEVYGI